MFFFCKRDINKDETEVEVAAVVWVANSADKNIAFKNYTAIKSYLSCVEIV